jgi:hypothetical protein
MRVWTERRIAGFEVPQAEKSFLKVRHFVEGLTFTFRVVEGEGGRRMLGGAFRQKGVPTRCEWAKRLIEKKPFKLVAVALANKMARIAFAIMSGKTYYRKNTA